MYPLKYTQNHELAYLARDNVAGYNIAKNIFILKYDRCLWRHIVSPVVRGRGRRERRTAMMVRVTDGGGECKYKCGKRERKRDSDTTYFKFLSRVAGRALTFVVNNNKQLIIYCSRVPSLVVRVSSLASCSSTLSDWVTLRTLYDEILRIT